MPSLPFALTETESARTPGFKPRQRAPSTSVWAPIVRALPVMYLLAMMVFALWPQWVWLATRMQDGSDNPLGLLAMAALLGLAGLHARAAWATAPRLLWLAVGGLVFILAVLTQPYVPALGSALLALLAMVSLWLAVRPAYLAVAPLMGLTVLALPLIASLQFYAGYPLRTAVAEVSRWLLMPFFNVQRSGASLLVDGQLILVDAACSGVQMAWWAYFTACMAALLLQLPNKPFLLRLPLVGLLVLSGNIVRNAILVALQVDGALIPNWLHEGIGLLVLCLVCIAVWWHMGRNHLPTPPVPQAAALQVTSARTPFARSALIGVLAGVFTTVAFTPISTANQVTATSPHAATYLEAPSHWQGQRLRPLALSTVEARFADQFPGRIERLTTGTETLIWRHVQQPTRMLHPAADCFRGMGYRIRNEQLEQQANGQVWRCFEAELNGQRLRVCEIIHDAQGDSFTDTSAWYWAALLGQSTGPWQAWTVVSAL